MRCERLLLLICVELLPYLQLNSASCPQCYHHLRPHWLIATNLLQHTSNALRTTTFFLPACWMFTFFFLRHAHETTFINSLFCFYHTMDIFYRVYYSSEYQQTLNSCLVYFLALLNLHTTHSLRDSIIKRQNL